MKTEDFNYELPDRLIAQRPIENRSESKLLIMNRFTGDIEHKHFYDIVDYLDPGDVLVINDTKVIPARIYGEKEDTSAKIEVLLLKDLGNDIWECLTRPQKRLKIGTNIIFSDNLVGEVVKLEDDGITNIKFSYEGVFVNILDEIGMMPLPPYIHDKLNDNKRYNTVYAKNDGSAAAPTAGLHFTEALLDKLRNKGVIITNVTLHVGLGTFRPVEVDDITRHNMHSEEYFMSKKTANILNKAKSEGRRIIAVGTTSTRVLETVINKYNKFKECFGSTNIFIYPGYNFRAIDALITNFHLPKSTLLMLVSAFSSKEFVLDAYQKAIENDYKFFSFGDAMLYNNK